MESHFSGHNNGGDGDAMHDFHCPSPHSSSSLTSSMSSMLFSLLMYDSETKGGGGGGGQQSALQVSLLAERVHDLAVEVAKGLGYDVLNAAILESYRSAVLEISGRQSAVKQHSQQQQQQHSGLPPTFPRLKTFVSTIIDPPAANYSGLSVMNLIKNALFAPSAADQSRLNDQIFDDCFDFPFPTQASLHSQIVEPSRGRDSSADVLDILMSASFSSQKKDSDVTRFVLFCILHMPPSPLPVDVFAMSKDPFILSLVSSSNCNDKIMRSLARDSLIPSFYAPFTLRRVVEHLARTKVVDRVAKKVLFCVGKLVLGGEGKCQGDLESEWIVSIFEGLDEEPCR